MATDLLLPDGMAPSNLHLRPSVKTRYVDGDMFDICERLAEISPRLYLVELAEGEHAKWMVMENCDDGVQRSVIPHGIPAVDARVLEQVQRLLRVPFEHRLAAIDRENEKFEADHHAEIIERMYEEIGAPMRRQFERDGFTGFRGTSYPKLGVAAPGRAR